MSELILTAFLHSRNNLTTLTLQSDAAIKKLQTDKEMGEKILRLAEMCRKLETEEEKVVYHWHPSLSTKSPLPGATILYQYADSSRGGPS